MGMAPLRGCVSAPDPNRGEVLANSFMNRSPDPGGIACAGNTFILFARVRDGHVTRAWCTGKMVRNMDVILEGGLTRDGSPGFTQRACCICNDAHALAAVRAIEDLCGVTPPRNARLVRSLTQAVRFLLEHLLHVYQFNLSDWVCLERALRADPAKAARLDQADRDADFFRDAQARLGEMRRTGGAEMFGPGLHDQAGYAGPEEMHLLLHAHGLDSLRIRATLNAVFEALGCGGASHPAYQVGGMSEDMNLGTLVLRHVRGLLVQCREFMISTLLPDLEHVARAYPEWAGIGPSGRFLTWGDFTGPNGRGLLFPRGEFTLKTGKDGTALRVRPAEPGRVSETVEQDWAPADADKYRLRLGSKESLFSWGEGGFEWLAAPRHDGRACEVGPLARMLGAWAGGEELPHTELDGCLARIGQPLEAMNSTLGRMLARGVEAAVLARTSLAWLDALESGRAGGDIALRRPWTLPASGRGVGLAEVSRGALAHHITREDGRITRHDYLIPSLWNFSPGEVKGEPGPLERALTGTPVEDANPLGLLRTVHAFDPCNACVVLMEDAATGCMTRLRAK